jgi:hypothetical protein
MDSVWLDSVLQTEGGILHLCCEISGVNSTTFRGGGDGYRVARWPPDTCLCYWLLRLNGEVASPFFSRFRNSSEKTYVISDFKYLECIFWFRLLVLVSFTILLWLLVCSIAAALCCCCYLLYFGIKDSRPAACVRSTLTIVLCFVELTHCRLLK